MLVLQPSQNEKQISVIIMYSLNRPKSYSSVPPVGAERHDETLGMEPSSFPVFFPLQFSIFQHDAAECC